MENLKGKIKKYSADGITLLRAVLSVVMIFLPTYSAVFFAVYIIAGVSDMLDGYTARKLNIESTFGEKLDTAADILFFCVSCAKVLPEYELPTGVWVWIGIIALLKIFGFIIVFIRRGTLLSNHSVYNKITGVLLFLLPIIMYIYGSIYFVVGVCAFATVSAITEIRQNFL